MHNWFRLLDQSLFCQKLIYLKNIELVKILSLKHFYAIIIWACTCTGIGIGKKRFFPCKSQLPIASCVIKYKFRKNTFRFFSYKQTKGKQRENK